MSNVSKQTGTVITIVTAILFGCASLLICVNSVVTLRVARLELIGRGAPLLFAGQLTGPMAGLCESAALLSLPVIFYFILVRGKPGDSSDKTADSKPTS